MRKPGDKARMAKMRARRAPFTDPREGRLKRQIRWAFWWSRGEPLTTTELMKHCYFILPSQGEKYKSWHRANVIRVADQVAVRIGRANFATARQSRRKGPLTPKRGPTWFELSVG